MVKIPSYDPSEFSSDIDYALSSNPWGNPQKRFEHHYKSDYRNREIEKIERDLMASPGIPKELKQAKPIFNWTYDKARNRYKGYIGTSLKTTSPVVKSFTKKLPSGRATFIMTDSGSMSPTYVKSLWTKIISDIKDKAILN